MIIIGFSALGGSIMIQINRYAQQEKIEQIDRVLEFATIAMEEYTRIRLENQNEANRFLTYASNLIRQFTADFSGTILIADERGAVLVYIDATRVYLQSEGDKGRGELPMQAVNALLEQGSYDALGTFYGFFSSIHVIRGVTATHNDMVGAMVFAASPADTRFFFDTARTFILLTLAVLLLTMIASIIVVRSTVKPLSQIANVSRSFARGDFSARVPLPRRRDELYQMTLSFNSMADAMENAENSRRSLMASVAHDLRTPMTTIAGFVDGILDGTIKAEKQDYYLKIISDEVKRLSRMANGMLEVSRLESEDTVLHKSVFDLSELVRRIIIGFEQKLNEKSIQVELDIPENQNITAEHDSIFQVVYNLIDNAVKYTEEKGVITIYMEVKSGSLMFHAVNTGVTIGQEDIKRIFDRYYTVDSSRQYGGGSGLGLYIVKTVINRHGGDIYAKSNSGKTEFCFSIPVSG